MTDHTPAPADLLSILVDAAFETGYYQGKLETKEYQTNDYLLSEYTRLNREAIERRTAALSAARLAIARATDNR